MVYVGSDPDKVGEIGGVGVDGICGEGGVWLGEE